ncbi:MAG: hypothetical protein HQ551_12880 [Desulfobacteraceae bacterium]|nr:hypothetical protein [Desulfobacteraceae bacterium]
MGVNHEQFHDKTIKEGKIWRTEQIDYGEGRISGAFEVVALTEFSQKIRKVLDAVKGKTQQ